VSHRTDPVDPNDRSTWPTPRGPWPDATGERAATGRYDHGAPWCAQAAGHPDTNHGYPDLDRHQPWNECQSLQLDHDEVQLGLDGPPVHFATYLALPFRYGQPRPAAQLDSDRMHPRIVLDAAVDLPPAGLGHPSEHARRAFGERSSARVSLSLATAVMLSRDLCILVDRVRRSGSSLG
jgi:hypothetical protein